MFPPLPDSGPFSLNHEPAYRRWRADKLARQPPDAADPFVTVANPLQMTAVERSALLARVVGTNLALFAWDPESDASERLRAFRG